MRYGAIKTLFERTNLYLSLENTFFRFVGTILPTPVNDLRQGGKQGQDINCALFTPLCCSGSRYAYILPFEYECLNAMCTSNTKP